MVDEEMKPIKEIFFSEEEYAEMQKIFSEIRKIRKKLEDKGYLKID